MKKIAIVFSLFFLIFSAYSQNLVKNSSFQSVYEKTIDKPSGKKIKNFPTYWNVITDDVRIDFFNSLTSTFHGFPLLKPLESGGRIGFPFYHKENKLAAIQTQLSQPLKGGKKYEVSFVIAQCQYSNYAVNKIPFILSKDPVSAEDIMQNENITVNVLNVDDYITYTKRWVKVRAVVTATGDEQYFTLISNRERFGIAKETRTIAGCEDSFVLDKYFDETGYYFIDAIEVIETSEDYKGNCTNSAVKENARDAQLIEKVEELKSKKIIHPTSPTSFKKMKNITHHIVLFDVSGSMASNINTAKFTFEKIYANLKDSDIVTGLVFSHFSRTMFTRAKKSEELRKRVNELETSGGTILETGLMLVNNNLVADENTKIYLITDVGNKQVSDKLVKYVSIKLNKTVQNINYFEYNYINNYTNKEFYSASNIYETNNVFRVHNMSRRDAKNFKEEINSENYIINTISKCRFTQDAIDEGNDTLTSYNTRNYVFLVDASGSMRIEGKMEKLKQSIVAFTKSLPHTDVSSLIIYEASPRLILNRVPNYAADTLNTELNKIKPSGGTGAEKAITYTFETYGGKNKSHQNVTVMMFTDGVFKVTGNIISTVERNRNIHFKVYQFGGAKNDRLQKLESQNHLEYTIVTKEILDEQLAKTRDSYKEADNPYSKAKPFKKFTKLF